MNDLTDQCAEIVRFALDSHPQGTLINDARIK
jgi:hypothetical protein